MGAIYRTGLPVLVLVFFAGAIVYDVAQHRFTGLDGAFAVYIVVSLLVLAYRPGLFFGRAMRDTPAQARPVLVLASGAVAGVCTLMVFGLHLS